MYNENLTQKFHTYITGHLSLKPSTKGFMRGDCPYCEGFFCFGVNFESGKTHCFKCSEGDVNLLNLVKFLSKSETYQEVRQVLSLVDDYGFVFNKKKEKQQVVELSLPEEFIRVDMAKGKYGKIMVDYLTKKRGLKLRNLVEKNVGYCDSGIYEGYILIPYYTFGKLAYFTTRRVMGSGPKFKNPEEEKFGIGKSTLIYNQDALFMYDTVHVVESAINSLTIGDRACGLGGKVASDYQLWLMLKAPVSNLILILDPDAKKESFELALKLANHKRVKLVHLPDGEDVNSFGRKPTMGIVKKTKYKNYRALYKDYIDFKDHEG